MNMCMARMNGLHVIFQFGDPTQKYETSRARGAKDAKSQKYIFRNVSYSMYTCPNAKYMFNWLALKEVASAKKIIKKTSLRISFWNELPYSKSF